MAVALAVALAVAEVQLAAGWQLATRCPPGTGLRHPWPPHLSGYFCPPADPASEADSAPPSGTFPTSPAPRSSPIGVLALAAKNFRLTTSMAPTPAPGTFFFPSLHGETWFKGPAFHHVIALLRSMGHPSPLLIVAPGSSVSSHWPLSAGALAHAQPTRTYRYQLILLSAHHLTTLPAPVAQAPLSQAPACPSVCQSTRRLTFGLRRSSRSRTLRRNHTGRQTDAPSTRGPAYCPVLRPGTGRGLLRVTWVMMDSILCRPLSSIGQRSSRLWIPEWARPCLSLGVLYLLFSYLCIGQISFCSQKFLVTPVPRLVTLVEGEERE